MCFESIYKSLVSFSIDYRLWGTHIHNKIYWLIDVIDDIVFALSCSLNEELNIQYYQFFGSDFTHCKSVTVNVTVSVLSSQAMRRNSKLTAVALFALLSALLKLNEGVSIYFLSRYHLLTEIVHTWEKNILCYFFKPFIFLFYFSLYV